MAAFLVAKLVSHTVLGAALGAFGALLQPSAQARAILLIAAGALMVLFALDMLGVRAVRRLVPRPPSGWGLLVRRSARTGSLWAPAALGFLTVLIPCGVTLSIELLAVTSGSALQGAAIMAGFVLGTMPLFAVLGYLLRRTTGVLQGRLTVAAGVLVLVVGVWTLGSGLRVGGWLAPGTLTGSGASQVSAAGRADAVKVDAAGRQTITIDVRSTSFSPSSLIAEANAPTTLLLRTANTNGCTRAFVIPDLGVQEILPATGETALNLGTRPAGLLRYTCSMGMYGGSIEFRNRGGGS